MPLTRRELLACRALRSDAIRLKREIEFPGCRVSIWRLETGFPPIREAVVETADDVYVATRDVAHFQRFLRDARPVISDVPAFIDLLRDVIPISHPVMLREHVGDRLCGDRPLEDPVFVDGHVVFYCNNIAEGTCERWDIDETYNLGITTVGKGIRAMLQ
jgi:hypothetical protein